MPRLWIGLGPQPARYAHAENTMRKVWEHLAATAVGVLVLAVLFAWMGNVIPSDWIRTLVLIAIVVLIVSLLARGRARR
jgi:uncharacterized membrane protein YfcA